MRLINIMSRSPVTGDDSNTLLWIILLGAAAMLLIMMAFMGKGKKK